MSEIPLPTHELHCTQCGGELHPDEGQLFLTCPYCSSTVYLDKSQVVFHWYLVPTLDEEKARGALMRWMAGNQTVKDLDRKSTIQGSSFEYFPLWYFKSRAPDGQEAIWLEPAAATSITEIEQVLLPAGDLRKYDQSIDSQSRQPSVPLQTALSWLEEKNHLKDPLVEQSLVHLPLYSFKYTYRGNPYTSIVEAGTGGVYANIYPAKAETPYRLIGCITALIFLCLAIVPIGFSASRGLEGTGIGLAICIGIGVIAVPIMIAIAAAIAAKV